MANTPEEGQLFRLNYLRSAVKLQDSERARRRILPAFRRITFRSTLSNKDSFAWSVEANLGIVYPRAALGTYDHDSFWLKGDLADVLSAITLWYREAKVPELVVEAVGKIFAEEDLQYRVDNQGGVHFLVDEHFAQAIDATLAGLGVKAFASARHALQEALRHLRPTDQSGKGLIRGVFEAAESAFLVVIGPGAGNRLNKQAIDNHLKPILLARYTGVPEASDKVARMLAVFEAWVKDAHPYRHGAPFDQVHEAPLDLAILSATTGMGFVRFLAGLGPRG